MFEIYCSQLCAVLSLTSRLHFEVQKLVKKSTLILKSGSSLLLISRGGIIGVFSHCKNFSK